MRKAETAPFRLEEDAEASALWTNASPLLKICSRVLSLGSQTKKQETPALLAGERLSWLGEERHYALKELRGLAKSAGRICDALKRLGPGSTGSRWVECSHARQCLPIRQHSSGMQDIWPASWVAVGTLFGRLTET